MTKHSFFILTLLFTSCFTTHASEQWASTPNFLQQPPPQPPTVLVPMTHEERVAYIAHKEMEQLRQQRLKEEQQRQKQLHHGPPRTRAISNAVPQQVFDMTLQSRESSTSLPNLPNQTQLVAPAYQAVDNDEQHADVVQVQNTSAFLDADSSVLTLQTRRRENINGSRQRTQEIHNTSLDNFQEGKKAALLSWLRNHVGWKNRRIISEAKVLKATREYQAKRYGDLVGQSGQVEVAVGVEEERLKRRFEKMTQKLERTHSDAERRHQELLLAHTKTDSPVAMRKRSQSVTSLRTYAVTHAGSFQPPPVPFPLQAQQQSFINMENHL